MKPAPFHYVAPTNLTEALEALAEFGYDAKLLAGGQSLIPTMNFRLAQPAVLVDLNGIADLGYITSTPEGGVRIGAMTRQRQVEKSQMIAKSAPLLSAAMPHIAHVQIRNRGTIGGSLAHADPAAELPAVMTALDASVVVQVQGREGERRVRIADFYLGLFAADLAPEEILTEIEVPPSPVRSGSSIMEITRRHGDFALAGVAVQVELSEAGQCRSARIIYFGVGEGPVPATSAAAMLAGEVPTAALIEAVAQQAASQDLDPTSDIHASSTFRRQLARVIGRRALREAFGRAGVLTS